MTLDKSIWKLILARMRRGRILTPLQIKLMDLQENGTFSTISINGISPGLRED
jgi:hypothetical protein